MNLGYLSIEGMFKSPFIFVIELNQLKKACYAKNRLYQGNHDKMKNQFKFWGHDIK